MNTPAVPATPPAGPWGTKPSSTPAASDPPAAVVDGADAKGLVVGEDGKNANASLYIGDLHEDVTEPVLYEMFSQPASVASIRICRDSQSQKSLGYGYVNYHTIPDAERAMDVLNFTNIKGKPCRIMWANRDKASRIKSEVNKNNVFVKNLDRNIDNKSLYDTFSLFGQIVSCKVATDSNGRSLGYGYVQYEKEQSLIDAIKRVNGMQIGKSTVYCGRHKRKDERQSLRDEKFTNLYVKGYNHEVVSDDQILAMFKEIGTVTSHYVKVDEKGRHALFVNFESFEKAKEAIKVFNNRRFDPEQTEKLLTVSETESMDKSDNDARDAGTFPEDAPSPFRLYASRHQSRAERDEKLKADFAPKPSVDPQPTVLYVRHFPQAHDDEALKTMFEPFGIVSAVKIARDEPSLVDDLGASRGFGFVTMPDAQDAQKAITGLHETQPEGEEDTVGAKLYVAYLEPKDTRQARLRAQISENIWRPENGNGRPFNPMLGRDARASPSYPAVIGANGQRPNNFSRNARPQQPPRPMNNRPMNNRPMDREFTVDPSGAVNDFDAISSMGFKEQKQAIGDRLYHVIMNRQPQLAGKITGMMLEMPNEDLIGLLKRQEELAVKIDEAIEVLKQAGSGAPVPK